LRSSAVLLIVAVATAAACGPLRGSSPPADDGRAVTPVSVAADGGDPAATATAGAATPRGASNGGEVVRIVDGDTLIVRLPGGDERVRLIGIDTPESVKPDSPVECYGHEAADRLAVLIPPGSPVELVRDVEPRDDYDRLLAYVFRRPDDLFVNLAMVADGFAGTLTIAPNTTFADDFDRAASAARASRLGLWGACPDPDALFGSVARR
jgi:micrococcal nuclease